MFEEWEGKTNLDQDENWRALVKKRIDYFLSTLEPDQRKQLDFSIDSLVVFGQWFLNKYKYGEDLWHSEEEEPELFQGAILYVGETYRTHLGGYWSMPSAEDSPMAYPPDTGPVAIIEGYFNDDMMCPIDDFYHAAKDRYDTKFKQILNATIRMINRSKSE
jgi:hypothetical protein